MTCAYLTQRVLVPGSQLRIGNAWVTVTGLLPNAGGCGVDAVLRCEFDDRA